jgi:hypothetical protein
MKNLVQSLGLLVAIATLGGCELYFGDHNQGGNWNYCGADGYYQCSGDNCTWVSPTCPAGGSGSGSAACTSSADCAAGCYCQNGTCNEGGFCAQDSDCGAGYHCNTQRSSCEPNAQPTGCAADNDCPQGQYCDSTTLKCTETCFCATDADAVQHGYAYCDESRGTCLPGVDPYGTCTGTVTCSTAAPACNVGEVATIDSGCYTGSCEAITACGSAPTCAQLTHETDCLANSTCQALYTGLGCHKPDNTACMSGDANCICTSFKFASCTDATP